LNCFYQQQHGKVIESPFDSSNIVAFGAGIQVTWDPEALDGIWFKKGATRLPSFGVMETHQVVLDAIAILPFPHAIMFWCSTRTRNQQKDLRLSSYSQLSL